MLFAVLSGLLFAIFLIPFGRYFRGRLSVVTGFLPLLLFAYFLTYIPEVASGQAIRFSTSWVPSVGLNLDFYLDGLALLFALLITGIGTLIFFYAAPYLKGHPYIDRFYGYLSLFMASMLGLVLADNILLLFIFWELTSISSFFLIGFNNNQADSRKSALIALGVTGGGGFLLMAGLVLMGHLSGTYSIQEMVLSNEFIKNHSLYGLILFLIFAGAMTKSAQFPFHFWLPEAMKAPTPVSAYLHSATMVKAGVFLLARLFPVLGETDLWTYPLMIIGGVTMLYAAFLAIFRTDLKSILAYTTISALGVMVFLIGIGTREAILAATVFILVHALYKATLFLVTGIIDHETGTRDITQLSGLGKVLLPVSIAGVLAALSSAGLPLTFGFIGKDLIYEGTLNQSGIWAIGLTGLALLTNVFLLCGGFLAGIRPFFGKLPEKFSGVHLPHPLMWGAPLLLAILGVLFGSFPAIVDSSLIGPAAKAMAGQPIDGSLKIWHGFNLVLLLSVITLVSGILLYFILKPSNEKQAWLLSFQRFSTYTLTSRINRLSLRLSAKYTEYWHNGYLRSYLFRIVAFAGVVVCYKLIKIGLIPVDMEKISSVTAYEICVSIVMMLGVYLTITTPSRLTAVVASSVVGYCLCLFFVFYSAPDLALTQFTIDTLTVVLFVLVLFRLPPFLKFANSRVKFRDAVLAIGFGLVIAISALHVLNEPENNQISSFYGDNAYRLAKGKNVVNVILVDFRGIDTMFEIVVLSIAAIGVYSLLKLRLKPSDKE
ncbi:MAG TPA: putative monovalent cation/H+ antiporter subunit A [Sphingobacteriaceae bacterium]|nr:putative monovalent cation/H+ antiporter subunit A [Sphingobacteriaceae bacterium]